MITYADVGLKYYGFGKTYTTFIITTDKLRVDYYAQENNLYSIIYDDNEHILWVLNHKDKNYLEINENTIEQFREINFMKG